MSDTKPDGETDFTRMVNDVNALLRSKYKNKIIGGRPGTRPQFELYHAAPSLCSHKVRTVLAEKQVAYASHDMDIMPAGKFIPENYRPEYVRMRLQGAPNARLVDGYTGESSVSVQGFDPCVVPTLVDHEKERVVIDSKTICEYVDAEADSGATLIPTELASEIAAQETLIDQAPHVAALYGAHPDDDFRPMGLRKNIAGVHARKIRVLNALIDQIGDSDPSVRAAYEAKIKKEDAASEFVIDADGMRETHRQMGAHVDALEAQLLSHSEDWVCGDIYTIADIMWTCSMWRLQWLGFGRLWSAYTGRDRLRTYLDKAFQRPAFRSAVIQWPGAHAPSPHVAEHRGFGAVSGFAVHMIRSTQWGQVIWGDPKIKLPPAEPIPAHQ
ncbi:MAG: glutathione S-transferase family protein [Pseudomonadota bacterium]